MRIQFCAKTIFAAGTGLVLAQACATPENANYETESASIAPVAVDESIDTQWAYLRNRYDQDGDGNVTTAEYTREGQSLERWDRDGDGVLSDADFQRDSEQGGGMSRANMMRQMRDPMARRMMSRYFQLDDENAQVTRTEYEQSIASYDANADGTLEPGEFRARAEAAKVTAPGDDSPMVKRFMGSMDPWDTIAVAVDADKSDSLSSDELMAFFDKMAEGDDAWELEAMGGGGRGSRQESTETSGPKVGTMAPDFSLDTPEGDAHFDLSDFRGEKPVALIFGSYT